MTVAKDSLEHYPTDSLYSLAKAFRYENPLRAKAYSIGYYKRAVQNNDTNKQWNAATLKAEIYRIIGDKDSAQYFADTSIDLSLKANDEAQYYQSLRVKGDIYFVYDDYVNAIVYYTEAYKYYKDQNDIVKLAKIRHNISLVENQIGRRKRALSKAKENLQLYNNGELDPKLHVTEYLNTLLNVSNVYTTIADDFTEERTFYLDSALTYNTLGLEKSLEANDLEVRSIFLVIQGIIHQKKGAFSIAATNFDAAEKEKVRLGLYNQFSILYLHKGKNYFLQNDIDKALVYLLKTDSIVKKNDTYSPHLQETYKLLAESYKKKGAIEKSVAYYKIYEEKDTENDALMREVSENLYKKYEIPSFKNKIAQLQEEAENEQQKSTTLIYICIVLILLFIAGFWYYKKREITFKKRFESILKEVKDKEEEKEKEKTTSKPQKAQTYFITDENIQKILEGLDKFEKKELFLQKNCTLNFVAKKIHTNSTYLSKTIQSHKQKKFVHYITDLRLDYALKRLKNDSKFRTYDIKSIALELGFNTAESFSKSFKKRTGIYPSFYIKNLNKLPETKEKP
jgi:AraC-like DNA-binding protein